MIAISCAIRWVCWSKSSTRVGWAVPTTLSESHWWAQPALLAVVFDVLFKPGCHFVERVFDGFAGGVAVGFVGEGNVADDAAVAADGVIEAFALDGEGAGIIVGFAVDEQDRLVD